MDQTNYYAIYKIYSARPQLGSISHCLLTLLLSSLLSPLDGALPSLPMLDQ